jgi:ATP-dependent RNA helicase DeaD
MPPEVKSLTRQFMREPSHIQLNAGQQTNLDIEQRLVVVRGHEKESALVRILEVEEPEKAIVFCRTKRDVDDLQELLSSRGFSSKSIHGDMSQAIRNQAVQSLKDGRAKIIIATDVAARGIDIPNVSHVINYSVPENRERYVHRIGRTGRAGNRGIALTLATPGDLRGNDVFSSKHADEFVVGEVPTLATARQRQAEKLARDIGGMRVAQEWREVAEDLAAKYSAKELALRLVSALSKGRVLTGDDQIGMSSTEGKRMLGSNDRGGGGKFQFGGKQPGRPPAGKGRFGGGFKGSSNRGDRGERRPPRRDDRQGSTGGQRPWAASASRGGGRPRPKSERAYQPELM